MSGAGGAAARTAGMAGAVVTAVAGAAAAGLHAAWAAGSAWPAANRRELAELTAGGTEMPGAPATWAVAGATGAVAGAAVISQLPGGVPAPLRSGARWLLAGAAVGLGLRGLLDGERVGRAIGLRPSSERFVALDRAFIRPACIGTAIGAALAAAFPAPGA